MVFITYSLTVLFISNACPGATSHVKHGARCAMGKVGGRQKPKEGDFNVLL